MSLRVSVRPELFTWALERSDKNRRELEKKFKKLSEWINGTTKPTLKQLESFSKATYVPIGHFFLKKPPQENIPIPDFRTIKNLEISRPSPNLLDTIYLCQQRQGWYQDFISYTGREKIDFVDSIDKNISVAKSASHMRRYFDVGESNNFQTWEEYLRSFVDKVRDRGIVVMVNSVVGSNNHRKLDVNEFRGFALCDDLAPLIFINGADSKSAQMFTLAHELAHIGLGKSALSNADLVSHPSSNMEVLCNKIAAEFLVPLEHIKKEPLDGKPLKAVQKLTQKYKVSSLVIIRRLFDSKHIDKEEFELAYKNEVKRLKKHSNKKKGGGDFYRTMESRIGKRFAQDVILSTLEGQTQFTQALRLLGIKKMGTFDKVAKKLGITI